MAPLPPVSTAVVKQLFGKPVNFEIIKYVFPIRGQMLTCTAVAMCHTYCGFHIPLVKVLQENNRATT